MYKNMYFRKGSVCQFKINTDDVQQLNEDISWAHSLTHANL